jgi:hypothetical protein
MPRVSSNKFFAEQSAYSRVKADIVFKRVTAWATVIFNPRFNQNAKRPILIVEEVLKKQMLRDGPKTYFNDLSSAHTESLRQEIGSLSGIHNLSWTCGLHKHPPSICENCLSPVPILLQPELEEPGVPGIVGSE